jgi:RNA polymerase sigma factor (sigma-70 family)
VQVAEPTGSTASDVLAAEPAVRRVIAARVADPADVEDLVHDSLERLWRSRKRLAPETVLPFAIVTARNVAISHARTRARRTAAAPRMVDLRQPERPDDALLATEARAAMITALDRLPADERRALIAYHEPGPTANEPRTASPGALRIKMLRTRAKARLEYTLAFRHVQLPTPQCRPILLAISSGDTRRQEQLRAGHHLLGCATCATLSEPLHKRSLALTAIIFPLALARWIAGKIRAHPVPTAVTATLGAAAAVAAATTLHQPTTVNRRHPPVVRPTQPARSNPTPPQLVTGLSIHGNPVEVPGSLRAAIGQPVDATGVLVEQVVTRNGFWVGPTPTARVWVELVGRRRSMHIVTGDHLRFVGTAQADSPSYPATAGVTATTGAALLQTEAAHLAVPTTVITIQP